MTSCIGKIEYYYEILRILDSGSFANIYILSRKYGNFTNDNEDNSVHSFIISKSNPVQNLNKILKISLNFRNDLEKSDIENRTTLILKHGIIPYVEKEFLYSIKDKNIDFFVKFFGDVSYGIFTDEISLIFECADCNLNTYYSKKQSKYKRNKDVYISFLKMCELFFVHVLDFLSKQNFVYGDWKLENILVYNSQNEENIVLKLTDFGSLMKNNVKITNLKNLNVLFSSPFLSNINEDIIPRVYDDIKSVCWIFWFLNGKELPWERINLEYTDAANLNLIIMEIDKMKLNFSNMYFLDVSECIYWPKYTTTELTIQNIEIKINNSTCKENVDDYEFCYFNFLNS